MSYNWETCSDELKKFICELQTQLINVLEEPPIGIYLHGSLAMGGFNPTSSDIDLLIVIDMPLTEKLKKKLAFLFLTNSKRPYPIEISILTSSQLKPWRFPTPYDFHYSEEWRKRYEMELMEDTSVYLNGNEKWDSDLAAHIMVLNRRGVCLAGKPIHQVFPSVLPADYLSSILEDYEDCLKNIQQNPVYCILNLIRVYWYLKEGVISSKQEAGNWGTKMLSKEYHSTIQQAVNAYETEKLNVAFVASDLLKIKNYLMLNIEGLLKSK